MSERGRRGPDKGRTDGKAKNALAELRALRESGKKRLDAFEVKEEEAVYEMMDDDDYSKLVAKRRHDGGGFVIGDKGMGYEDVGEECDWGEDVYGDGEECLPEGGSKKGGKGSAKDAKGAKGNPRKRPADEPQPGPGPQQHTLHSMHAKAEKKRQLSGPRAAHPSATPSGGAAAGPGNSDALLDDILSGLGADGDGGRDRQHARRAIATAAAAPAPAAAAPVRRLALASSQRLSAASTPPAIRQRSSGGLATAGGGGSNSNTPKSISGTPKSVTFKDPPEASRLARMSSPPPGVAVASDGADADGDGFGADGDGFGTDACHDQPMHAPDWDEAVAAAAVAMEEFESEAAAKADAEAVAGATTPAGAAAGQRHAPASGGKTPWKTPPPVFAEAVTPATAAPAAGWQQLYNAGGANEEEEGDAAEADDDADAGTATAPAPEWVDDGSLPLDPQSNLPFYFMDAHEEANTPGSIYLFGKVPAEGGRFLSCCAIVRNMQRCVYFVPTPGSVPPADDPELMSLEEAAAKDPSAKGAMFKRLHELFSGVKAEARSLLEAQRVTKMTMRPVKRQYAFENRDVPHGVQYVLKVKYPASQPALPLGLTGKTFCGTFGTNQSMLETLLLKRRVMGASWVLLKQPTRVQAMHQLSWCKLEVEVQGPKAVLACPADIGPSSSSLPRDAPPLTVAAISLKTVLGGNGARTTNEIIAASCVYQSYDLERPHPMDDWRSGRSLRHFSVVRRLDGRTWPLGFEELVRKENASPGGKAQGGAMLMTQPTERNLLICLLARLSQLDVDVVVGHNAAAFDLDVLLHRLQHHKVPNWSRIGRLKRSGFPHLGGGGHQFGGGASHGVMTCLAGRLLCDTYLQSRELLREVEYTLATLSTKLLQQQRTELNPADITGKYDDASKLLGLMQHAMSDAWLALGLSYRLNMLPLTRQLSTLSGSLWSKALLNQRSGRIEMLLLHEFHGRKFLLPDKLTQRDRDRATAAAAASKRNSGSSRSRGAAAGDHPDEDEDDLMLEGDATAADAHADRAHGAAAATAGGGGGGGSKRKAGGPQYAGGLVLEPKSGLYDKFVLLLDFNSLYPSIIQEYNIDFTTVQRPQDDSVPPLPETSDELAVLPKVIQTLVQRRRQVKALLKEEADPVRRQQLDIRQQALKLTANSMYGCLGFGNSRFYAKPLAQLITSQGREILQSTVDLVRSSLGLDVIYGDTDSIMVATGSTDVAEVQKLGFQVKREVNKKYRYLELDLDGVYKCMLLLKKKKYAAIKLEGPLPDGSWREEMEAKGLDIVRRDWCPLSKDCGNFVLREVLSGRPAEDVVQSIHAHLRGVKEKLDSGLVPHNKFVITKQLTKRPEDYPDARNQPHVQVALRRRKAGKQNGVMQGETVPYIICVELGEDGEPLASSSGKSVAERAYHPDEIRDNPALRVDLEYYRVQQVHPVISRLCAPIEGTDASHLADCLGLDPARFRGASGNPGAGGGSLDDALLAAATMLDDDDRYKDCDPLWLSCGSSRWQFPGVLDIIKGKVTAHAALQPPEAQGEDLDLLSEGRLANQVTLAVRRAVTSYYAAPLRSDDDAMPCTTANVCLRRPHDTSCGAAPPALGTAPPDPKCSGAMGRTITEGQLYTQLTHLYRLMDVEGALSRLGLPRDKEPEARARVRLIQRHMEAGLRALAAVRDRCAYRYIDLGGMFGTLAITSAKVAGAS